MGDDIECLSNKLLSNIDSEFKNDPDIDEYDLIPVQDSSSNKNPVRVIDHKLAIELWAAKVLYCSASNELRQWCLGRGKTRLSVDADWLKSITRAVLLVRADHMTAWNIRKELVQARLLDIEEDLKFGQLILTKHPKSSETFSQRKWLLEQWNRAHSNSEQEYNESCASYRLSQTQDPSVICHTRGIKCRYFAHTSERHNVTCNELEVCGAAASRYRSNYCAWTYRQFVLKEFACCRQQMLEEEFTRSLSFIQTHVGDHSGFHYRQVLLSLLKGYASVLSTGVTSTISAQVDPAACSSDSHLPVECGDTSVSLCGDTSADNHRDSYELTQQSDVRLEERFTQELSLTEDLILAYPNHEAIWNHRRFILFSIMQSNSKKQFHHHEADAFHTSKISCDKVTSAVQPSSPALLPHKKKRFEENLTSKLASGDLFLDDDLYNYEEDLCGKVRAGCRENKDLWEYTLSQRHLDWLNRFCRLGHSKKVEIL